jgi:hypothetical protein
MGVAELDPPSNGTSLCGPAAWIGGQTRPVQLSCGPSGGTMDAVAFASYGQPTGACPAYAPSATCHAANSSAVVAALCVGQSDCTIPMTAFGDPCPGQAKWLAVSVTCTQPAVRTRWDFSVMDDFMLRFWDAVTLNGTAPTTPIVSWSTPPTWLYDATSYAYADDPALWNYGYYHGAAPAGNLTALGDYYGRVAAWYTRGGFTDEAGVAHTSGHFLNWTVVELVRRHAAGR